MHDSLVLETERLALTAMTAPALRAWLEKDAEALRTLTGAWFPEPVESPPLFGKDLPMFLDRMEETPAELGWWVWLVQRKDSHLAVGVCGLSGRPLDGGTMLGYSVYPEHEGHGYATEASKALVASSSKSRIGSLSKALAMAIRWRCPPDNLTPCSPKKLL